MKKTAVVFLVLIVAAGAAFAQQRMEEPDPKASLMLNIGYSLFAPIGVSGELFLPGKLGVGGMLNGLFFGDGSVFVWSLNPGAFVRYYLGEEDGPLYLNGGVSYLTGGMNDADGWFEGGILQLRTGIGYSNIFGGKNQSRMVVEVGAVYQKPIVKGVDGDFFSILPYLGFSIGGVFY